MRFLTLVLMYYISAIMMRAEANEMLTVEPEQNSYNFVSHYRIEIDAPASVVWKNLIDLRLWMVDFEMSHQSGEPKQLGEVLRLYPEQDFFIQITGMIPNDTLVIANLPSTFKDEYSTGVGVITLNEIQNKTMVNLTMSRRYTWQGKGENSMKNTRESPKFVEDTQATWNRFLEKLRSLAETK